MALTLPPGLPPGDEKAAVVQAMFDRIAPRYDLLNRLFTFRLDQRWRRTAVAVAGIGPGDRVVDLGCGTGDMCRLAADAGATVIGVDFAAGMLAAARTRRLPRVSLARADAAALPLSSGCATVVTTAFTLRNFVSITAVLREAARVLAPRGRLVLLEVDEPKHRLSRWGHSLYFRRVVPFVGGLLSDAAAYAYLPRSTAYLPPEDELLSLVTRAGFSRVTKQPLSRGIAQLLLAIK